MAYSRVVLKPKPEEDAWWRAVLRREAALEDEFVYAVRSTGIYCRAACPSRRPARRQVVFFDGPEAAEKAGFRACRRCRPADFPAQTAAVRRMCRYLETHCDPAAGLAELGRIAGWSASHAQRTFKRLVGISPREYAEALRLKRLKERLQNGAPVTEALYAAGYGASSRLYEGAPARLGMTPATYGRRGRGMCIRYGIVNSRLGALLVAATGRGICAVTLGNSAEALETGLREEFAAAEIARDQRGMERWTRPVLEHLAGQRSSLDLPLDVVATAFQRRVWDALRAIPYGATQTYADVAQAIGNQRAVRAVARACATNPAALVIPCHRVVPRDAGAGGYRWGVERKKLLLETEAAHAESRRT